MGPPFLGKPVYNLILVGVVLNPLKQSRGIHRFINRVSKVAKQFVHFVRAIPRTFESIHGRPEWRRRFEDLVSSHWCSLRRFQRWAGLKSQGSECFRIKPGNSCMFHWQIWCILLCWSILRGQPWYHKEQVPNFIASAVEIWRLQNPSPVMFTWPRPDPHLQNYLPLWHRHQGILPPLAGWRSGGWRGSRRGRISWKRAASQDDFPTKWTVNGSVVPEAGCLMLIDVGSKRVPFWVMMTPSNFILLSPTPLGQVIGFRIAPPPVHFFRIPVANSYYFWVVHKDYNRIGFISNMEGHLLICVYIYIYTHMVIRALARCGQDWTRQHVATCGNMWQHVATCGNMWQHVPSTVVWGNWRPVLGNSCSGNWELHSETVKVVLFGKSKVAFGN